MAAKQLLFDSSILEDFLRGKEEARRELMAADEHVISILSWIEIMGKASPDMEEQTRQFLGGFELVMLDKFISERAYSLRRDNGIAMTNAVIWATAQIGSRILVTRNIEDFPAKAPGIKNCILASPIGIRGDRNDKNFGRWPDDEKDRICAELSEFWVLKMSPIA